MIEAYGVRLRLRRKHSLLGSESWCIVSGRMAPGEPIVFVAAAADASPGRVRGLPTGMMDHLKTSAQPSGRREHGLSGGAARWIEPTAQDDQDARRWDAARWSG